MRCIRFHMHGEPCYRVRDPTGWDPGTLGSSDRVHFTIEHDPFKPMSHLFKLSSGERRERAKELWQLWV